MRRESWIDCRAEEWKRWKRIQSPNVDLDPGPGAAVVEGRGKNNASEAHPDNKRSSERIGIKQTSENSRCTSKVRRQRSRGFRLQLASEAR
jgi:hypothetical protein